MKKKLAFVLGGGGSRGAMQAGALRALLEAGYKPDVVTGTSIGAANGAFLSVHGYSTDGIQKLERVWHATVDQDLLPTNLWWQMMRSFFKRSNSLHEQRIRDFAIANGLAPDLHFEDLQGPRLYLVATDLNTGAPVIFGRDPKELVLDGVMASMTLPPWMSPKSKEGRYLMDGGAVSNLPIEAALEQGATEIIALDLFDPAELDTTASGLGDFFVKLDMTVESRQARLEMQLAEARGVPVRRISLIGEVPVALWDFRRSVELIENGYRITHQSIESWRSQEKPSWWRRLNLKSVFDNLLEMF
jgi:NTE family protein